jgi:nucleoporin GLE1
MTTFSQAELQKRQLATQTRRAQRRRDMQEVTDLLSALEVTRKQEEAALHASFEARNADLWASIEAAIQAKEQEQSALQAARQKQVEAEQKAKSEREAALVKAQQEAEAAKAAAKERAEAAAKSKAEQEAQVALQAKEANVQGKSWAHWHEVMGRIKADVLPAVSANDEWKKLCREAKRAITPKVGQLTNSSAHISAIVGLLFGAKPC